MLTIFLVIDVILAIILVGLVLVQRSDGSLGSIGGGASSVMSTRSKGNFLTKSTAIVAALFMICSVTLCLISRPAPKENVSVLNSVPEKEVSVPVAADDVQTAPATNDTVTQTETTVSEEAAETEPEAKNDVE